MASITQEGTPEWARCHDLMNDFLGRYREWTVVAEIAVWIATPEPPFFELRYALSYLADNREEILKEIFQRDTWDTQYDQGRVDLLEADEGAVLHESLENSGARVFITLRKQIGPYPECWRMWPTFENYFDLRTDEGGNLVDPYTSETVAQIPSPSTVGPVKVRTEYLQDYLAARNMILVRQHDIRRHWKEPINGLGEDEEDGSVHRESWGCYRLDVFNSRTDQTARFSRLVAKDVVTPFQRAGIMAAERGGPVDPEEYPEFIISRSIEGATAKARPNECDIPTVAYFDPRVLKKYYDEPRRYSVGFSSPGLGGVSFLDQWSIAIGRNSEGYIVLWLSDLHKQGLPYEELVHWRAHNNPPRGGMADDFYNAQLMCSPPTEPSIEERLKVCRSHIIQAVAHKQLILWKPLSGPDTYAQKTLRRPLFDDHGELRDTILLLSKMFIEYLDVRQFRLELKPKRQVDANGQQLGRFALLSRWLEDKLGIDSGIAERFGDSLRNLQLVRSKAGVAHGFSDSAYSEVTGRLRLVGQPSAKSLFDAVAGPLADSLEELCSALGVKHELWWVEHGKS